MNVKRTIVITICFAALWFALNAGLKRYFYIQKIQEVQKETPKPLISYSFPRLKKTIFPKTDIRIDQEISQNEYSEAHMFSYSVPKFPGSSELDEVSGVINIPKKPGIYPVIIMFRGFVPKESYLPGIGTQRAAGVFVREGYITLAPDFLGFGQSASPSADPFEDRFQTYTTALTLVSSVQTLSDALAAYQGGLVKADKNKIGLWGHSNGGHIALSVLAISGLQYPTVLWAPVSKSFPYSILYYSDETDDQGKAMRKMLSMFENDYNVDLFSPTNFISDIKAPISIHQGSADQEVPVWWSDELVTTLKNSGIKTEYFTYLNADHNLMPSGWSEAVQRSVIFYASHLQ